MPIKSTPRLRPDDVTAAINASIGNPKFTRTPDGNSLYLLTRNGRGYWCYQWRQGNTSRAKMLGTAADMSPAAARQKREEAAVNRRAGIIPERRGIAHRKASPAPAVAAGRLFGEVAEMFLTDFAGDWAGGLEGKEAKSYRRTLITESDLAMLPVAAIETHHVEAALKPYADKPVTAGRVLMRIGKILNYAGAKNLRDRNIPNPAQLKGHFEFLARPVAPATEHHPAMKWADVPGFMKDLLRDGSTEARALAVLILTGLRTDELRLAKWKEIVGNVWTVPAERMKGKKKDRRPHSVPLVPAVIKLLGKRGAPDDFIFPSRRFGNRKPLRNTSLREVLTRLRGDRLSIEGLPPVPHGFRSSMRDWFAEKGFDRDLAERAIAHKIGGKTESAYQRSKLIELRRPLMAAWAKFCMSKISA
jgi:integrase